MKRKVSLLMGNAVMVLGMIIMVGGVGYSLLAEFRELGLPIFFEHGALVSLFVGGVLWLFGAAIGGRDAVADRYWWVKHFDKRCRR